MDLPTSYGRPRPSSCEGLEAFGRLEGGAPFPCPADDGARQRVFGVRLDGTGETNELSRFHVLDRGDVGQHWLTLRERAGLVEDDHIDLACPLEGEAVLDEEPVASAERRRDGDDERDGQS